jgi:hypothetical protein
MTSRLLVAAGSFRRAVRISRIILSKTVIVPSRSAAEIARAVAGYAATGARLSGTPVATEAAAYPAREGGPGDRARTAHGVSRRIGVSHL